MDYMLKMFNEFKKVYGIDDTFENSVKYKDLFVEWVVNKRKAAKVYTQLFDYMLGNSFLDEDNLITEIGKGNYDTISCSMTESSIYKPIVVSPYASTIDKKSGIKAYFGELIVMDFGVLVKYPKKEDYNNNPNCSCFNELIRTLLLQVPFTDKELWAFIKLLETNKNLFIGTYGMVSDLDAKENLLIIQSLYTKLLEKGYDRIDFEREFDNGTYVSAISSKPKTLTLVKTR